MLRLIVALTAALAIASLPKMAAAEDAQPDPVSVMKRLFEARNSANPDAAAALFAVDAEVVNAVGARLAGMDAIRRFMARGIAQKGRYEVQDIRYEGGVVRWSDLVTNDVYRKLEIAPVEVVGEAVVDQGKIKSFITHFPPSSMEKFERALRGRKGRRHSDRRIDVPAVPPQRNCANAQRDGALSDERGGLGLGAARLDGCERGLVA